MSYSVFGICASGHVRHVHDCLSLPSHLVANLSQQKKKNCEGGISAPTGNRNENKSNKNKGNIAVALLGLRLLLWGFSVSGISRFVGLGFRVRGSDVSGGEYSTVVVFETHLSVPCDCM